MSRKLIVAALLAATAALTATPTFAANSRHPAARYNSEWRAPTVNDPTQYMVENSIPVEAHQTPGIAPSATSMPAASEAYAYAPPTSYRSTTFANDPTMYAIRNSIPETYPHVPGFGARP